MKRSFRTPGLSQVLVSWMAVVGTAALALAGTADTPRPPAPGTQAASGPHSDGADAVLQTRQREGQTGTSGKLSRQDQQFLTKAAAAGRAEVEMGRLGQARAQNTEVKSFAERMVEGHGRVNGELEALGSARGLSGPHEGSGSTGGSATGSGARPAAGTGSSPRSGSGMGKPTSEAGSEAAMHALPAAARHSMERLQGLSGAEFDREFMKQMVTDHKSAVAEFQRAASSASDPEIKSFAQKTLPGLQEHLQMARSLSERLAGPGRR